MRTSIAILSLSLFVQIAPAAQGSHSGDWQTTASNRERDVVLYWTPGYEGGDAVYRIDITPRGKPTTSLRVVGQPVFNADSTLVAFPHCADDGCLAEIDVVDLVAPKKIPSLKVPEAGQLYLTCTWRKNVLLVAVESGFDGSGKSRKETHAFPVGPR